jgi:hypothetical protein
VANNGKTIAYGMSDGYLGTFDYENTTKALKGVTSKVKQLL